MANKAVKTAGKVIAIWIIGSLVVTGGFIYLGYRLYKKSEEKSKKFEKETLDKFAKNKVEQQKNTDSQRAKFEAMVNASKNK